MLGDTKFLILFLSIIVLMEMGGKLLKGSSGKQILIYFSMFNNLNTYLS